MWVRSFNGWAEFNKMRNASIKNLFTLHSPLSTLLWIAVLLAACCIVLVGHDADQGSRADAAPGYLDPQTCRPCHAEIFRNYQKVAMGRSFYKPSTDNVVEDYTTDNHFFHAPSNRHYRMVQRDGKFFQRRYQLDDQGREKNVFELEVTHIMGSGNHARTYLNLAENGVLRQLPVSWYSQGKGWGMSPGYDHARHDDFRRRVGHSCMFCHNGYPRLPEPSDRYGQQSRFPRDLPSGIDCQRCHGPGSRHVNLLSSGEAAMTAVRAAIVNPARLSPERQMDVCMQCHVQSSLGNLGDRVRRAGRSVYSFRPGESLDAYIVHFDLVGPDPGRPADRFEIDSTAYRLLQSACYQESRGAMTCTTCHDPHRTPGGPEAVRHFRQRCMSCHPSLSGQVHSQPAQSDCVPCHMPRRRTEDAVHVVMTDHWIQRRPPERDLLTPLEEDHRPHEGAVVLNDPEALPASDREIYWGLAQIQSPSHLRQGLSKLEARLSPETSSHPEFYAEWGKALLEAGEPEAAEARLRQALELDSNMVTARTRLADMLREQEKWSQAVRHYRLALAADPHYGEAEIGLGLIAKGRGQIESAIAHFRRAVKHNPFLAEGFANLGTTYLQQGEWNRALQELEKALSIEPANAQVYLNMGTVQSRLGRQTQALEAFAEAVRLDPDLSKAHYSLGLARARAGQPAQAIEAFRQAVQLNPEDADYHFNLGVAHNELGQLQEALAAFRESVRLRPEDPEGHSSLGLAYAQLGRLAEALQAFQKTASIRPNDPEVRFFLGMVHVSLGNRKSALQEYETLKRLGALRRAGMLKDQLDRQSPGARPRD